MLTTPLLNTTQKDNFEITLLQKQSKQEAQGKIFQGALKKDVEMPLESVTWDDGDNATMSTSDVVPCFSRS